jgi:iron-sulfur cluster assembly protein
MEEKMTEHSSEGSVARTPEEGALRESPIELTEAAARAIVERAAKAGLPGAALRVRILGGGCSGATYRMSYDAEGARPGDCVVRRGEATLLVDERSLRFLRGATLDFRAELMSQRFVWKNPNAKSTCGCGESFSL